MPEDTLLTFDDNNTDALLHAIDEAVNAHARVRHPYPSVAARVR